MSKNVYIVEPKSGYGSDDMVIVAGSVEEAEAMYFNESGKTSDYYKEERNQGANVHLIDTKNSHIAYVRQDNL